MRSVEESSTDRCERVGSLAILARAVHKWIELLVLELIELSDFGPGTWARRMDEVGAMADSAAKTTVLVQLLERMQGGDRAARDELVRAFQTRLEHLARKMLHRYPSVGRWVEVEDVLQGSLMRLLRRTRVGPSHLDPRLLRPGRRADAA